jgi:hypothetical protein
MVGWMLSCSRSLLEVGPDGRAGLLRGLVGQSDYGG